MTSNSVSVDSAKGEERKLTPLEFFKFVGGLALLVVIVTAFVHGASFFGSQVDVKELSLGSGKSLFVAVAPNQWRNNPSESEKMAILFEAAHDKLGFEAKDRGKRVEVVDTIFADPTWVEILVEWVSVSNP